MQPLEQGIKMTIRFEGLNSTQVDRLHKAAAIAKTKRRGAKFYHDRDKDIRNASFVEVTKSELRGDAGYTVLLTIHPAFEGYVRDLKDPEKSEHAVLFPSREGLDGIFDAANILPVKEIVEEIPGGGSVPGRFGYSKGAL